MNQATLLHRFDCVPIRGERSVYFIIFQPTQDWIATERIGFKLLILLHMGEQILFGFCQLGRDAAGLFLRHQSGTGSLRSSESAIAR